MLIKKAQPNRERNEPVSFRFSMEAFKQLSSLSEILGKSKTEILEECIADAYKEARRAYPKDFAKIDRKSS